MRILVVGLSTRAIAESAVRSQHPIVTLDYFGDRDQRALVENHALMRDYDLPFSAEGLLRASRGLDFEGLVYISNLENHPRVVEALARDHVLLGNPPDVLRRARDWRTLRAICAEEGISHPATLLPGEEAQADPAIRWLRKPVRSGSGHGIRFWDGRPPGELDEAHVLQVYVEGRAASAAFVADGRRGVLLGLTEQLIGREELGAEGFGWCGNVLPLAHPRLDDLLPVVEEMVGRLVGRLGLRGLNGIDFVVAEGPGGGPRPYLVEINPRYTASMELVERACGLDLFSLHLAALEGRLPAFSLAEELGSGGAYLGKGIIFARGAVAVPETAHWRERGRRDVPFPGERIEAGHPVCTVLAEGKSRAACWQNLLAGVAAIRREIADVGVNGSGEMGGRS